MLFLGSSSASFGNKNQDLIYNLIKQCRDDQGIHLGTINNEVIRSNVGGGGVGLASFKLIHDKTKRFSVTNKVYDRHQLLKWKPHFFHPIIE